MNRRRRRVLASAVAAAALAGLLAGACGDGDPPASTSTASARSSDPRLAASAASAREWLVSRVDALPPYVFLVIDHLRRRFGMEFPAGGDLVAKAAGEGAEARAQLAVYARLVDPSVVITAQSLGALSDEVDLLTGPALACDQLPLPPDYLQTLQRAEDRGGPERTHAVLALQWLVEHGCIEPEEAAELSARWADGLVETVEQQRDLGDGSGDLAVEAMVMLAYSGHADRIRQEWVEDVLKGQRPDGAWQRHEGDQPPSEHTTVLGLWLMLELEDPSAPRSSWIPQP